MLIHTTICICPYITFQIYIQKWEQTTQSVLYVLLNHTSTLFLYWLQNIPSYGYTISIDSKMAPRNILKKQKFIFPLLQPSTPNPKVSKSLMKSCPNLHFLSINWFCSICYSNVSTLQKHEFDSTQHTYLLSDWPASLTLF